MPGNASPRSAGLTRRALLAAGGGVLAALVGSGGVLAASAHERDVPTDVARGTPGALRNPPEPFLQLHPARTAVTQCFVREPRTGEWFTTQVRTGTSGFRDAARLEVSDIVVSRLAADGTLLDSMRLPDAGHGMGLIVRVEAGVRVLYSCWFAPGPSGRRYDVVRLPYAPGTADRAAAATVVPGVGYPLDPSLDLSTGAVTVRHQGGTGPEYTRHRWADFAAGDLSRATGGVVTADWPPTHQGFCSHGDRFFLLTGAASDERGGDPALLREYRWATGRAVGRPLDVAGLTRLPDGTYPHGRMEPEGAGILIDRDGTASLLVGVVTGSNDTPRTYPLFRYSLGAA